MKILLIIFLISVLLFACARNITENEQNIPSGEIKETVQEPINGENVKEFNMVIEHRAYTPNSFTVKKGDKVRFLAIAAPGTSSHNHGITIDEFNINVAVLKEDVNNPEIIEFVADKAGTFEIYCMPCWDGPFGKGHPEIKATLVVEE